MRRPPHSRQQTNNHVHRWTVSYADYMTLMFALFVVLYSVTLSKEEKYQEVIETIQNASQLVRSQDGANTEGILTKQSNDISDSKGPALVSDGDNVEQGFIAELPVEELSAPIKHHTGEPLQVLQESLQSALQSELEIGAFSVDLQGDWLIIELSGPLLFAAASHTLLNDAKKQLGKVAAVLKNNNNMIRLRGYTDVTYISDELYKSNWELSAMRAISVLHALEKQGISGQRMVIEGFGRYHPVLNKNGLVDKLKSRRVVIAVSKYAVLEETPLSNEKVEAVEQTKQAVPTGSKPDSEEMREIYLPDGRLIITTRQEE